MKRFAVCLIAAVMSLLGMAPPSLAAGGTAAGTISVSGDATTALRGTVCLQAVGSPNCGGVNFQNGAFEITAALAGDYKLRISASNMDDSGYFYQSGGNGYTTDPAAATVLTLDTGTITLDPMVVPQLARVTGSLSNANGQPVPNASGSIFRQASGRSLVTDSDGNFNLGYMRPGLITLIFNGGGGFDRVQADVTVGVSGSQTVPLIRPALSSVTGAISDSVTGLGQKHVDLELYQVQDGSFNLTASTETDAAGEYAFTDLSQGVYILRMQDGHGSYPITFSGGAASEGDAAQIAVGPTPVVRNEVLVDRPNPCSAYDAGAGPEVCGAVTGLAGEPLVGVRVSAQAPTGESVTETVTDRSGRWALDLVSGDYKFAFESGSYLMSREGDLNPYLPINYGGTWLPDSGAVLTVGSNQVTGLDAQLERSARINMALSGPGGDVTIDAGWTLVNANDLSVVRTQAPVELSGNLLHLLVPGGPDYKLLVFAHDPDTGRDLLPQWVGGPATASAAPVIATQPGSVLELLEAIPLPAGLAPTTAPSIKGTAKVGRTLTAKKGVWNLITGTTYSYKWMRGTKVVGTKSTYVVKKADRGKRIVLKVKATNGAFTKTVSKRTSVVP